MPQTEKWVKEGMAIQAITEQMKAIAEQTSALEKTLITLDQTSVWRTKNETQSAMRDVVVAIERLAGRSAALASIMMLKDF